MPISLRALLSDSLYEQMPFKESIDATTYELISEIGGFDPKDSYDVIEKGRGYWEFSGESDVKHFIRIILGAKETYEVKLGFFDGDKPVYDKPNLYHNDDIYQYDRKVLNTYIKTFSNNVLPYFFEKLPNQVLRIPATDHARYRLYKMMLHQFLDNQKYEVVDDDNNTKFSIKLR
jgi:hypothetical protein